MSNLSLSQEYMMCALNDKGKISAFSLERSSPLQRPPLRSF